MTVADFERPARTRTNGAVAQRAKPRARAVVEIATGFSALALIVIGTMAVCLLLSLPQAVTH